MEFFHRDEYHEMIPCEICGTPTELLGYKRCVNCWEVERRLDEYLKSSKARESIKIKMLIIEMNN